MGISLGIRLGDLEAIWHSPSDCLRKVLTLGLWLRQNYKVSTRAPAVYSEATVCFCGY